MGVFDTIKSKLRIDWCSSCHIEMDVEHKQLYALPDMTVGHYVRHENADYYKSHLIPIEKKAQLAPGVYACGLHVYRCSRCGRRVVNLTPFLPVRDQEKYEQNVAFENGELDDFIY